MLHEALVEYLSGAEKVLAALEKAYVESYLEEIITPARANLRVRVRFDGGQLLEVNEAVVVADDRIASLDYRYHYQDEKNRLIFRYDSTPHFPDLPSFPNHKHLPDETVPCEKPSLPQVVREIVELMA